MFTIKNRNVIEVLIVKRVAGQSLWNFPKVGFSTIVCQYLSNTGLKYKKFRDKFMFGDVTIY